MPKSQSKPKISKPRTPKRGEIVEAAVLLFACRPYHEVRLEDVADAAGVSKGTIYTYFKSKDDLFASLIRDGLNDLLKRLSEQTADSEASALETLREIVRTMSHFCLTHSGLLKVMNSRQLPKIEENLAPLKKELFKLIEKVLRRGTKAGELQEWRPAWTARYLGAMIAEILLVETPTPEAMTTHVCHVLLNGLRVR